MSSQLTSNKSLLNQGTGDYGMEENARMTGFFTGLAHKDAGQVATTHLEFGVQFKEMLVNASKRMRHFHNDAGGDCTLSRSCEETGTSSLFLF